MSSGLFRFLIALALTLPLAVQAQQQPPDPQAAWDAASAARISGPVDVPLGAQAVLHLPESYIFLPLAESTVLMRAWGNGVSPGFMGIVTSASDEEQWVITIEHVAEGFVKDDDARNWDHEALLDGLREGTEAQNKERASLGIPALDIIGWVERPTYDAANHRLVWSISGAERGAPPGKPAFINFNTYALGRDGYFELDLITNEGRVEADKDDAQLILASLEYNRGRRYQDYVAGTDKVATYGIAALVGGLAAKKLGLLALIGVFLAKFAKIGLIALVAGGAAITRLFRGKGGQA